MYRRNFLAISTASLAAALLSQCGDRRNLLSQMIPVASQSIAPKIYRSQNGLLALDLEARLTRTELAGQTTNLLSYSGRIPGSLLEAHPGDTVRLRFRNQLATPTNLHFHGLHIPPTGIADNPFRIVAPGEQVTYEFTLPKDHPSTTAYYHPHLHGYVAQQIFGGLGGIFVVRGELDEIPEVKAAQEEFIFLKDFDLNQDANYQSQYMGMQMLGREGELISVNGQVTPRITVTKGLVRLRIVNASTSRFYRLAIEDHPLYLIATDGGAIDKPRELSEILLSPGERAEVFVNADRKSGEYRLLNLPYERAAMGMGQGMMGRGGIMGRGRGMMNGQNTLQTPEVLAAIAYADDLKAATLPDKLIAVDPLAEPSIQRRFTLNHGMVPGQGMVFSINGQAYQHDRIDTRVKLGTVEDWEIVNTGVMDHPFHLHTNRFQIISRNNQTVRDRAWKDTVLVPTGESATIRVAFNDFPGKTVYHCHILDHEDLGMMGVIEMQA